MKQVVICAVLAVSIFIIGSSLDNVEIVRPRQVPFEIVSKISQDEEIIDITDIEKSKYEMELYKIAIEKGYEIKESDGKKYFVKSPKSIKGSELNIQNQTNYLNRQPEDM